MVRPSLRSAVSVSSVAVTVVASGADMPGDEVLMVREVYAGRIWPSSPAVSREAKG